MWEYVYPNIKNFDERLKKLEGAKVTIRVQETCRKQEPSQKQKTCRKQEKSRKQEPSQKQETCRKHRHRRCDGNQSKSFDADKSQQIEEILTSTTKSKYLKMALEKILEIDSAMEEIGEIIVSLE